MEFALIAVAGVLIVFMFLSSRRRRREVEEMRAKILPGAEIMTGQGLYGTLVSLDEEKNEAIIETTPGVKLRIHSQAIAKVVEDEPVAEEAEEAAAEGPKLNESSVEPIAEPEFGERTEKKPAPRSRKKASE